MISDQMRVALDAYLSDPKAFWSAIVENHEGSTIAFFGEAKIGDRILVRTVTFHYIGTITAVTGYHVALRDSVKWIDTTGEWKAFLESNSRVGDLESYPEDDYVCVTLQSIVDWSPAPAFERSAKRKKK